MKGGLGCHKVLNNSVLSFWNLFGVRYEKPIVLAPYADLSVWEADLESQIHFVYRSKITVNNWGILML